jgi:hypothetical protein
MPNGLHNGDILIKHSDGSLTNKLIRFGQFFGRGDSKFTHAGILPDHHNIIEMDGHGLQKHALNQPPNNRVRYTVYSCQNRRLGHAAANVADMMLANFGSGGNQTITYDKGGALGSIWSRTGAGDTDDLGSHALDRLLGAGDAFFCSGHVVLCYQIAASQLNITGQTQGNFPIQQFNQLFSLKDTCYQPAYLEKILRQRNSGFTCTGIYLGEVRQQVGG